MDDPVPHSLKIADTPADDDLPADTPPVEAPPLASTTRGKRRRPGKMQRRTPEEMDVEIRQVNLKNGILSIAPGTEAE